MRILIELFGDLFSYPMTLGSNKTKKFSAFFKNESKKRKNDEMNGFVSEDNFHTINLNDNQRYESHNYETPSKRSRIEVETKMSNNSNINTQKSSILESFRQKWRKFRGKPAIDSDQMTTNPENTSVVNTFSNNTAIRYTSGSDSIKTNNRNSDIITTNESIVSTKQMPNNLISFPKLKPFFKRKRPIDRYKETNDKQVYQMLLNKHTAQHTFPPVVLSHQQIVKKPEVIDLCPPVSSLRKKSPILRQSSVPLFNTETLDKNSNLDLINRIKSKGVIASELTTNNLNKSIDTLFGFRNTENINKRQSTPKLYSIPKTIQTEAKTPEISVKRLSTETPESSKKFNDLFKQKKDYLNSDFTSDLRESLIKSTEYRDKYLTKTESKLIEFKNKRKTDLSANTDVFKSPLTRAELTPFVPFVGYDDRFEEEEEEEAEDEESVSFDFPELTPDMNKEIDSALRPTPPNEVLSEGFSVQICRKDMETLKGLNWLNDEIINFYLTLIVERGKNDNFSTVYAFNTFFYKKLKDNGPQSLKRWTRKIDVFSNDLIFVPIHLGMHWCLAVIDFINKRIDYYDSMGGNNMDCVQSLKVWLQTESLDKKKCEFPMTEWTLQMVKDIPQQGNGSDCGMFTCKYAEYISRKAKINFSQAHMPYFRRRMVYEILTKQLL